MANRPAGYSLSINSWENDADNYKTVVLDGLMEGDVVFYIHLLQHFRSSSNGEGEYFGNGDCDHNVALRLLNETFQQYPPDSNELKQKIQKIITHYQDDALDMISDLLGGLWNDYQWLRVFDSYEIHSIPQECVDVTEHFRLNFEKPNEPGS